MASIRPFPRKRESGSSLRVLGARLRGDERISALVMLGAATLVVMMMVATAMGVAVFIGAAFGIERRFERLKPRAEPAQHIFDHVIAADAQPLADNLDVDVTIADVPSEAGQIVGVRGGDFDKRLGPADDPDDRAVLEHEAVAVPERDGLRKIEQEFCATLAAQHHAPAMTFVRVERNRIDSACLIPMSGGLDIARALHG
jgi:hypothetical protein